MTNIVSLLLGERLKPFDGTVSFDDPVGAQKPFAPHYEQYIRHNITIFEEERINALKSFRKRIYISAPIMLLLIGVTVFLFLGKNGPAKELEGLIYVVFFAISGLTWWCNKPTKQYKSAVKNLIFPDIFRFFGEDFGYNQNSPLSANALDSSGIIPNFTNEKSEDYVRGIYKDVTLELFESKLTKTSGYGKSRRTKTVFKGMFILLSMNKDFSGQTIVKKDIGKIGNWLSDKFNKLETVSLEDPVFEKIFEVYSSDQVEARYLLTTSFMERLLSLSELFGNKGIQCSFYNNKLLLMIPSKKDHFETGSIYEPATFVDDINIILNEMNLIFEIIDILKLDQNIGL